MDEQQTQALQSLRDRIRAVCVHDQAQWDATWEEVFGDLTSNRRGLIPPSVFFQVLEANSVVLVRSEARLLLWQFQKPNGAVAASKFLRWMALNAPGDHVDPDSMFPQLPQPFRCIKKVLDHDIFDAAWFLITKESARFKEAFAGGGGASSSRSNRDTGEGQNPLDHQRSDFDTAKRRSCEPTWRIPLDNSAQRVAGLASHCLLPVLVAAVSTEAGDSAANSPPLLRLVSTAEANVKTLGDFPVSFPLEAHVPAGNTEAVTNIHVSIKKISALQLATDGGCCLAVHLEETTSAEASDPDASPGVQPPAPTTRECVGVYSVSAPDNNDSPCELIAVISPPPGSSISSIVLSQDSSFLSVTWMGSKTVALYSLREIDRASQAGQQPLLLSSPAFQVDLEATRSPFLEDERAPTLHFLVAPAARRAPYHSASPAAPTTYAFVLCYGLKVLKYVLPAVTSSTSTPTLLTPAKFWEHLTSITASAQDLTTQFLVAGCQDGTIVLWDVQQDIDYAFLSPASSAEVSSVMFCQAGYVVALSQSQQRLYFFDVRSRGKPALMRVVSPPSGISMTSLAESTAAADLPVALVAFSDGMVLLYDVRVAEAIGSLRTAASGHAASSSSAETTRIVGNQETLAVAGSLYSWRDVLLASVPSISTTLEQRQEELTWSNIKQLFSSSDEAAAPAAPPPSTITAPSASVDQLETMFLRMAGQLPLSPQRATKSVTGASSPLQSPTNRSSVFNALPSQLGQQPSVAFPDSSLAPIVPDLAALFEQRCLEQLDPLEIADKEAKLHRKRRELLKIMSAGGAW